MKELLKKHRLELIWVGFWAVANSAVFVGLSLVLQYVIDRAIEGNITKAVVVSVGFALIFGGIYWLASSSQVRLNVKVMKEIREKVVNRILGRSNAEFKEHDETDYISLVQNDVKRVEDSFFNTLYSCIKAIIQLILAIVVMTYYSPVFTFSMFIMTAVMFVVPCLFSKKLEKGTQDVSKAQEVLTQGISDVVYGYEVTKSFQKENYRMHKFEDCNLLLKNTTKKLDILKALNEGVSNVLALSMQMVICILAGFYIYLGHISYGSMVGVIQVSGSITSPLFQLFTLIPTLKALKPIWKKIEEYTKGSEMDAKSVLNGGWGEIRLENIHFSYSGEPDNEILTGVTLNIQKGKKYLIVGESGSGKTTLINILASKLKPTHGKVLVDGKELLEVDRDLQYLSAGVWQNVFLFNESIADNILMGDDKTANLSKAISTAALEDVIDEKGIDYIVGINGDQLSGGQKQRIAIARALFAGKDILIMDEGLSALNEDMGNRIEKALLGDVDLTLVSVSHHASEDIRSLYDEVIEII